MTTLSVPRVERQWLSTHRKWLGLPILSYITSVILLAFLMGNQRMWHWFILPTFVCGLLVGSDISRWFSGEHDLFDPKGIMGIYGWYFFFLAPLIFIHYDIKLIDLGVLLAEDPPDWRPWVGYLSIINVIGLILFQAFHHIGYHVGTSRTRWSISPNRVRPAFIIFGGIALISQAYYFYRMGGLSGVIGRRLEMVATGQQAEPTGLGLFAMAGNSLPIIILIYMSTKRVALGDKQSSLLKVSALLIILTSIQFILSGLGGSRSATVFRLLWFAGIIHHFWRRVAGWNIAVGLVVIAIFMYVYGFYKAGGDAIERIGEGASFSQVEEFTGRSKEVILIADLSRVYVQSYEIYRLQVARDYDLRLGETYLMAVKMRIPTWIWPSRPTDDAKVIAGTDLVFGRSVYRPGNRYVNSSWVYGLAGEAMLNFGIFLAPATFAIWGFLMGIYRYQMSTWLRTDARWFLVPYMAQILGMAMGSDLELIIAGFILKAGYVLLFLLFISRRVREEAS